MNGKGNAPKNHRFERKRQSLKETRRKKKKRSERSSYRLQHFAFFLFLLLSFPLYPLSRPAVCVGWIRQMTNLSFCVNHSLFISFIFLRPRVVARCARLCSVSALGFLSIECVLVLLFSFFALSTAQAVPFVIPTYVSWMTEKEKNHRLDSGKLNVVRKTIVWATPTGPFHISYWKRGKNIPGRGGPERWPL